MSPNDLPLPGKQAARELLDKLVATPPLIAPRVVDKPLVLYGAGNLGRMAKDYFDRLGISVMAVIDVDISRHRSDPFWQGVEMFAADAVPPELQREAMLALCVATAPYESIRHTLSTDGWQDVVPFYDICEAYRDRHPLGNGWFAGPMTEDAEAIAGVLDRWGDDISRAHHLQFIAWHALREEWRFEGAPVTIGDRYFIPELLACLHDHENLVDVGAHLGEVSRQWIKRFGGRFDRIRMIEADRGNYAVCAALADADVRIDAYCHAVADIADNARFSAGLGYASQIDQRGEDVVDVRRLDDLPGGPVTYLKLHLEGWELAALKGAGQLVARHRPIIAVTAYHNRLGLWELPMWFFDQLEDYRILFRLHSWCGTGAVIYAIPEERCSQI